MPTLGVWPWMYRSRTRFVGPGETLAAAVARNEEPEHARPESRRRVVLDPLTRAQVRQLAAIGRRVMGAIDPEDRCLEG